MTNTNIVTVDGFEFQYREDDYVNLTKMCKQVNRLLSTYLRSNHFKEYIQHLAYTLNCTADSLIEKRVGGVPSEQGTYGHPLVAIHLGYWCSAEFALIVSKLTQSYLKADISLAEDIISRTPVEQINDKGASIAGTIIDKATDDKVVDHIQARANTKQTNKELNRALAECPNVSQKVFPMAQDSIYKATHGVTTGTLKKQRGITKNSGSLRDTLSTDELVRLSFCESMATKVIDKSKPSGDINCSSKVYDTAKKIKLFEDSLLAGII